MPIPFLKKSEKKKSPAEIREEVIKTLTVDEIPREIYHAICDDWKKTMRLSELNNPDPALEDWRAWLPIVNTVISGIVVLILLFKH